MTDSALERAILRTLRGSPATIQGLVDELDVPHGRVKEACQSLRARGFLGARSRGYFVVYALTDAGKRRLDET